VARVGAAVGYSILILATVGAFLLVRAAGETLTAPPAAAVAGAAAASSGGASALRHVLVALAAVIVTGRILSRLLASLGQPPVIGEVLAGILLGPSLIGADASSFILPAASAPVLGVIAQLGIILYMFIVGLDLNAGLLRGRGHAVVAISHASISLPFVLGAMLALCLYPRLSDASVPFTSFALFLGTALSITAFPVLARILSDRGLTRTDLGVLALSCAAIDDVTAWCLLALVVGVARAAVGDSLLVAAGSAAYIAVMLAIVRPYLRRLARPHEPARLPQAAVAAVFLALLLSSLTTELIGIHAVFGAFLLGAVIPHDSAVARAFSAQLEPIVTALLLPAFFAFTGMRTRLDLLQGAEQWLLCGLLVLVATLGKFGGTFVAARLTGQGLREAACLGTLMNTRGLMELIVANVGLELEIISPVVFSMLVLMALVTTMATSPVLRWLLPDEARNMAESSPGHPARGRAAPPAP
jgi:Kef-type K+ transport system membrane component KefB